MGPLGMRLRGQDWRLRVEGEGQGRRGPSSSWESSLHPTPHTPHPTPYTLHPTPYVLHPTPGNPLTTCSFWPPSISDSIWRQSRDCAFTNSSAQRLLRPDTTSDAPRHTDSQRKPLWSSKRRQDAMQAGHTSAIRMYMPWVEAHMQDAPTCKRDSHKALSSLFAHPTALDTP